MRLKKKRKWNLNVKVIKRQTKYEGWIFDMKDIINKTILKCESKIEI